MDNKQYNKQQYNKRVQWYRITLGFQQLINYPIINIIWILFIVSVVVLGIGEKKLISNFNVFSMIDPVFHVCMKVLMFIIPVICALGIIQFIGEITARRDEADMSIVFGEKQDTEYQTPILIYKKKLKKKGVTVREFYTTIPMRKWQEQKDAICDRLTSHLVEDIKYGGKNNNNGNRIVIISAKGRKTTDRGVLYDDIF